MIAVGFERTTPPPCDVDTETSEADADRNPAGF
jgi:hypothetical protein